MVSIDRFHALQASKYTANVQGPRFLHWNFNRITGRVDLTFTESIDISFFNYSRVVFVSGPMSNHTAAVIVPVTYLRVDSPVKTTKNNTNKVSFTLNSDQFMAVTASTSLLQSATVGSYIVLEQMLVLDSSPMQNIYHGLDATYAHPMVVRHFYIDDKAPALKSFTLDMRLRIIALTFTEVIRLSSIALEQLSLQSELSIGLYTEVLTLSSSICQVITTEETGYVEIQFISEAAFSVLKAFTYLAKSFDTTYISLTREFATDTSAGIFNQIEEVRKNYALQVTTYIADNIPPYLVAWTLDLTQNMLVLSFSKPINSNTMKLDSLILTSDPFILPSTSSYTLSTHSYIIPHTPLSQQQLILPINAYAFVDQIVIQLSITDTNGIKSKGTLCRDNNNEKMLSCFLSTAESVADDIATYTMNYTIVDLPVRPVSFLPVSSYIKDSKCPIIMNSTLDMTMHQLMFIMDEPVNSTSWNATAVHISFGSENGMKDHGSSIDTDTVVVLSKYSVEKSEQLSTKLIIQFTDADFIRLELANPSKNNLANITLQKYVFQDVADNYLLSSSDSSLTIFPSSYIADVSPPALVGVYLNVDESSRNLTLYFNKTIAVNLVDKSHILLVSSSGATLGLGDAVLMTAIDDHTNAITLNLWPMVSRLNILNIGSIQSNTFVYINKDGTIVDKTLNANRILAMTISEAIPDGVSLHSFRLNMIERTISLELIFPFAIRSINPSDITISPSIRSPGDLTYTLSGYTSYQLDMLGSFIVIELSSIDYIAIRKRLTITTKHDITLEVNAAAIMDVNGKVLSSSKALPCSQFIRDSSPLSLVSYQIDLNAGVLQLTFSKEVQTSTVDLIDTMYLQSLSNRTDDDNNFIGKYLPLTNLSIIDKPDIFNYIAPNVTDLYISLNHGYPLTTREQILDQYPLSSSLSSTFLSIRKGMVYDLSRPRNALQSISTQYALKVSRIIPDSIGSVLLSFDVNLNTRILSLYYNEAVQPGSLQIDTFNFLQNPQDTISATYYQLTTSKVITNEVGKRVKIALSSEDINNIMNLSPNLLVSSETTYLFFKTKSILDIAHPPNYAPEVLPRYAIPVNDFTQDTTPPLLLWYNMSIETGDLVLFFDELIYCSATKASQFVFQHSAYTGTATSFRYQLSSKSYVDCSGPKFNNYLYLHIDVSDALAIKAIPSLAKYKEYTYLRLLKGAIYDVPGNPNDEMIDGYAMQPTQFDRDLVRPELLSYLINDEKQLNLFFSKPMDINTLQLPEIWLQDDYSNPQISFQLMNAQIFRVNSLQMRFDLQFLDDYNRILDRQAEILNKQDRTFLRLSWKAMNDTSMNAIVAVNRSDSIQLGPSINQWNLNMNTGRLELFFSEIVNLNFTSEGLTLQNHYFRVPSSIVVPLTTTSYFFESGSSSTSEYIDDIYPYSTSIFTVLSSYDLNTLKSSGLASRAYNIYLTAQSSITHSLFGGDVQPFFHSVEIYSHKARPISRYSKDVTPPVCLSFGLDLSNGYFILYFDEPVLPQSLVLSDLVLFSTITGYSVNLHSAGSVVTLVDMTVLTVHLSDIDLNTVKRAIKPSAVSSIHTLDALVMSARCVTDVMGNGFIGNTPTTPIFISTYIPDTKPPSLLSWTLDFQSLVLTLTFDEFIDATSINPASIVILSNNSITSSIHKFTLSCYSIILQDMATTAYYDSDRAQFSVSSTVSVDLGLYRSDGFLIQTIYNWDVSLSNIFLAMTLITDIFDNNNTLSDVKKVSSVHLDQIGLTLQGYDLSIVAANSSVVITMYFNKYIKLSSFKCNDFSLSDAATASNSISNIIVLDHASCVLNTSSNYYIITFHFPSTNLISLPNIINSGNSWIFIPTSGSTTDLYNNALLSIDRYYSIENGPQVVGFVLDLNTGLLTFSFTKSIDITQLFDTSAIGLYNSLTSLTYMFESRQISLSIPPTTVSCSPTGSNMSSFGSFYMSYNDLLHVKLLQPDPFNLLLLIDFSSISSPSLVLKDTLSVVIRNRDTIIHPLQISRLIIDTFPPTIQYSEIDLSSNRFIIQVPQSSLS